MAYHERDGIVIHLGDSREVLPTFERESFDIIVTDPPYGVNWQSNSRAVKFDRIAGDDGSLDVPGVLAHAGYALRRNRHAYVFGEFDLEFPLGTKGDGLVWDKMMMGGGDVSLVWGPSHERITFAVRAADRNKANMAAGGVPARLRQGTVLSYPRPNGGAVKRHPTEKPVPLLRRLIESSSLIGERVLDPFVGCGSTLVAAVAEGRRGVGIELDERYAATAAERVDAALDAARLTEAAFA